MLVIDAHAAAGLALGDGVVQPVFAADVEGDLFVGAERGGHQTELRAFDPLVVEGSGTEIGVEPVLFVSVEIDGEVMDVVQRAERRLARLGLETVVVEGDVAQGLNVPLVVETVGEKGLIIKESGVVLALGVEAGEDGRVTFVTDAVQLGEPLDGVTQRGRCPLEIDVGLRLQGVGLTVGDVEHGRHLVAIFGRKTAGGEFDILDHSGVDERETFLLAVGDELGTIDLYAIDIHEVLVETAAAYGILAGEFVVHGDARHGAEDVLDGVARGGGDVFQMVGLDLLGGGGFLLMGNHLYVIDIGLIGAHLHIQLEGAARPVGALCGTGIDHLFDAFEAHAGEDDYEGIALRHAETIFALEVGQGADIASGQSDMRHLKRFAQVVGDASNQEHALRLQASENEEDI